MSSQPFNRDEYEAMKRRVEALESRIRLDPEGSPERENAKLLLPKIKKRLEEYEATHDISKDETRSAESIRDEDNTTFDSSGYARSYPRWERQTRGGVSTFRRGQYQKDNRSVEEMIRDLGVLYAIFGSTYQTTFEGNDYKIRFKKKYEYNDGAFYRVWCDIYENDQIISSDVVIGFWPFHRGDTICGDMEISWWDTSCKYKYFDNCRVYKCVIDTLKWYWNKYFGDSGRPALNAGKENTASQRLGPGQERTGLEHLSPQAIRWLLG